MLRTNIYYLTPLPTKCPVDDKRGESEYVHGPLGKLVYEVRRTENCSCRFDFRSYFEATSRNWFNVFCKLRSQYF